MTNLNTYLDDGANKQARAVMCLLQGLNIEETYDPEHHFYQDEVKIGRWLTGSCESGRLAFAKAHGLDLDQDTLTVAEFIALTKGAYGSDVIARLAEQK